MSLSDNMPEQLADLVRKCWSAVPEERPTFAQICEALVREEPKEPKQNHQLDLVDHGYGGEEDDE